MRRLWIFNHYAVPPTSGAGTRHADLGRELARTGWDVTIFASSLNHFTGADEHLRGARLSYGERIDGVRFVWIRTPRYKGNGIRRLANMAVYSVLALIVQARHDAPTHVIGSTAHPLAAFVAKISARLRRARFYFEIRDLWPQSLIDLGIISERSVAARGMRWLERVLVETAVAVIALPPGVGHYFAEHGMRPRTLVHIPNGVDLHADSYAPSASAEEATRAIQRWQALGRYVAVYAGAHGEANGLNTVVDAARVLQARNATVGLILIGDGPNKRELEALAADLSLTNVKFARPVPKTALRLVLQRADACLLHVAATPVHRYGVSFNKLYDYMASGKPIVFACETPYDTVAEAACGVSIPPGDPEALADALVGLSTQRPEDLEAMGRRAREYAAERHDIRTLGRQLHDVLTA